MKCPKCSYVSFDFLDTCRKCSADLVDFKAQIGLSVLQPGSLDLSIVLHDDLRHFTQPATDMSEDNGDVMVAEKSFEGPPSEGYMTVMLDISDTEEQSIANLASPESLRTSGNARADETENASAKTPPPQGAGQSPEAGGEQRGATDPENGIELPADSADSDDSEVSAESDSTIDMLSGVELSTLEERQESKQPSQESPDQWGSMDRLEAPSDQSAIDLSGLRTQPEEREQPDAESQETERKPTGKGDAAASQPPKEGYVTIEMDVEDTPEDDRQERQTPAPDSRSEQDSHDASQANSFEAAFDLESDDVDEEESFLIDLETLDSDDDDDNQTKHSSS